jgi:hypothetical protein
VRLRWSLLSRAVLSPAELSIERGPRRVLFFAFFLAMCLGPHLRR